MPIQSFVPRWIYPRRIAPHRILTGRLRGARIVTSWSDYPAAILGVTEAPLLTWFDANVQEGATWLDVGGHYGFTAIALSRLVGRRGRVFTFEPMIATAGCVAQARVLNNLQQLTVVPQGLGCPASLQSVELPAIRGMADSTLTAAQTGWTEAIQIARFDWLWPQINYANDRIDGIKIDVQGMELDVLEGMREMLARQRPKLVIELHHGVSRSRLMDLLCEQGYSLSAVAVDPAVNETTPQFLDDRSYAFCPA